MEEADFLMANMHMDGKRMFEDAMTGRNVCKRKVIIEKHLPKYMSEIPPVIDQDFLISMGATLLISEAIHKTLTTQIDFRKYLGNIFESSSKTTKSKKDAGTSL